MVVVWVLPDASFFSFRALLLLLLLLLLPYGTPPVRPAVSYWDHSAGPPAGHPLLREHQPAALAVLHGHGKFLGSVLVAVAVVATVAAPLMLVPPTDGCTRAAGVCGCLCVSLCGSASWRCVLSLPVRRRCLCLLLCPPHDDVCVNYFALGRSFLWQADVFVAADSSFSSLVAKTRQALTIVPTVANADKKNTTYNYRLCSEGVCAGGDSAVVLDTSVDRDVFEKLLAV